MNSDTLIPLVFAQDSAYAEPAEEEDANDLSSEEYYPDFNLVVAGDFGCGDNAQRTVSNMLSKKPELVLDTGDLSYSRTADCWLDIVFPLDKACSLFTHGYIRKKFIERGYGLSNSFSTYFLYPFVSVSAPIELTTDYANLWYKKFDSVKVKEIYWEYTLLIVPNNINELLSPRFKRTMNEIHAQQRLRPKDILKIRNISKIFKKFETDSDVTTQLSKAASTYKPSNIEFVGFGGKTRNIDIRGTKLAVPDSFNVKLKINFDAKQLASSAKFVIDYNVIAAVISRLSREADALL